MTLFEGAERKGENMGRQACCEKVGLKRGPWTIEEDHKLMTFILNNGIQCWRMVPKLAGLQRCGKSCRLRWINYLRPDLKRGELSQVEENQIIQLHSRLGNRWSKIASHFPGRTDNEIKNHWNTRIKKRLKQSGIDPVTHQPQHVIDTNVNNNQLRGIPLTMEIASGNYEESTRKTMLYGEVGESSTPSMLQSIMTPFYTPSYCTPSLGNPINNNGDRQSTSSQGSPVLQQWDAHHNLASYFSLDIFNQLDQQLLF